MTTNGAHRELAVIRVEKWDSARLTVDGDPRS